eukprot:2420784-Rhodomonas_salina.1
MRAWGHDILSRAKVTVVLNARTNFDNIEVPTVEGAGGLTYLPTRPDSQINTEHCALAASAGHWGKHPIVGGGSSKPK